VSSLSIPARSDAHAREPARGGGSPVLGCDTLVALPPATADGSTLFAKNSDRPALECQPLVQVPPRRHRAGSRVRCQYISIHQVRETHGFIGSQPFWLWGLEHGVNDCRVAIGNETVFSREPPGAEALLGMDLLRLGLERSETAREALEVITGLLEAHGQGGPGHLGTTFSYHNSFLIADPTAAWVLETVGKQWAAREVDGVGNISNHISIDDDWSLASADLEAYAVERGWWKAGSGRIRFASAYCDAGPRPSHYSAGRCDRGRALLQGAKGRLAERDMMRFLRDHGESGTVLPKQRDPQSADFFTLCMHGEPISTTTASMVARSPISGPPWPPPARASSCPCTWTATCRPPMLSAAPSRTAPRRGGGSRPCRMRSSPAPAKTSYACRATGPSGSGNWPSARSGWPGTFVPSRAPATVRPSAGSPLASWRTT
jgi:secernin